MPWEVRWYDDAETIVLLRARPPWDWAEFDAAMDAMVALVRSKPHPVHAIYDLDAHYSKLSPSGIVQSAQRAYRNAPPNSGVGVLVGANTVVRTLLSTVSKMLDKADHIRYADSLAAAEALLAALQTTASTCDGD